MVCKSSLHAQAFESRVQPEHLYQIRCGVRDRPERDFDWRLVEAAAATEPQGKGPQPRQQERRLHAAGQRRG